MSINRENNANRKKDFDFDQDKDLFFDDDFEVIYEGDLPEISGDLPNDNYKDVLSSLSSLDPTDSIDVDYLKENLTREYYYEDRQLPPDEETASDSKSRQRQKKRKHIPNLLSPAVKTLKTGGKAAEKLLNLILRAATLILTAVIIFLMTISFWKNHSTYGNITTAAAEQNYILAAYLGTAFFLLFIECIAFLSILFASRTRNSQNGQRTDTGRGLFSFLFIYLGSWFSLYFSGLIPSSPAPLQGLQGALSVYGSLQHSLFILCAAGVASCLIRKFIIK